MDGPASLSVDADGEPVTSASPACGHPIAKSSRCGVVANGIELSRMPAGRSDGRRAWARPCASTLGGHALVGQERLHEAGSGGAPGYLGNCWRCDVAEADGVAP